jgi:hypothetical protein
MQWALVASHDCHTDRGQNKWQPRAVTESQQSSLRNEAESHEAGFNALTYRGRIEFLA